MNTLYNIFNQDYIQWQMQQQIQAYHINQAYEVQKSAKALQDFLDSFDKIGSDYKQMASTVYCKVLADYFRKHSVN